MAIEAFATHIPTELLERSGKVFYSGRNAFSAPSPLYMLGVNPGGSPEEHAGETVKNHTHSVIHTLPGDWSAYRDESWRGRSPGAYGMAPRVLHLLRRLGISPGSVPASNLVFARSRREADIHRSDMASLADACWPFHDAVIRSLRPRAIVCFGSTAGNYVRRRLNAKRLTGEFVERNDRQWRSKSFESPNGTNVVIATHPSIANWCAEAADITPLVEAALQ